MTAVAFTINGRAVTAEVEPRTHLADFIRDTQTLTGTHLGCEHGVCGACTVLLDGVPVRSCITYAVACSGATVTTIEGLDDDEIGTELRAAFSREHALQCGYCTPGMLISGRDLVLRAQTPDEKDIRAAMSGNLCRCTGYVGIVRAIQSVIADRRARGVAALVGAGRTALGPAGSGHGESIGAVVTAAAAAARAPANAATADQLTDWKPQASFDQSFTVNHPIAEVWDFFANTAAVAACLPGVSVSGDTGGRNVAGKMRIKVGPIAAEFHGAAEIDRDCATHSGTIQGSGRDPRSSSATRGIIRYHLLPVNENTTNVELNVGYRLTGPLAQFSRADLVHDIASRLIAAFAQQVEARLGGADHAAAPAAELKAGRLFLSVLTDRIKARLRRVFGRDRSSR
ncbi:MAG TPA: 2Fe-2S iron-sulfur cluster-binding protein [Xanthobacteraceae bacterium]|nr:2Fe-2S iron-sulfur cluster-binding protein [Xanthobacteraceae bacterium]